MPIADVTEAIELWRIRKPLIDTYRDYDAGRHQLRFASPDFEQKFSTMVMSMRENLCPPVIAAYTDRILVDRWGDEEAIDDATREGLDRLLARVNREAFRTGDAYALVWPGKDQRPNAHFHRADAIVPHVDPDDSAVLDRAAKVWTADGYGRVNVYYADRVERWITAAPVLRGGKFFVDDMPTAPESWRPFTADGDPDTIGHEYQSVPVCWWTRTPDEATGMGTSILTDVIPLQDGLNTSLAHMIVNGEAYAKPFWFLLNFQPRDATNPMSVRQEYDQALGDLQRLNEGAARRFDPTRQRIFTHDGPGPFGQLDPPDLTKLLAVQDGFAQKIARVAGIPNYYLTQNSGDVPSGESLRILTSRLTAGVQSFTREAAPVWRGFKQLMGMDESAPRFGSPFPLSQTEALTLAAEEKALGLPVEVWLRTAGYDPNEADEAGVTLADRVRNEATAAQLGRLDDFDRLVNRGQLA